MTHRHVRIPVVLVALSLGCGLTDLDVENKNAPDREDVFPSWAALEEAFFGNAFHDVWTGMNGEGAPAMGLAAMADEISVQWGNYGVRSLSGEPRTPFDNSPDFRYAEHAEKPWFGMYTALSDLYDGVRAIDDDTTGLACIEIDCDRARAWAKFVQGVAHGWLALMFDSAFVLDESIELFDERGAEIKRPLLPYHAVWAAARQYLDSASALGEQGSWSIPPDWLGASTSGLAAGDLARLARAHVARWIPQVARTPAERATVDWAAVIDAVADGLQSDFTIEADGTRWYSDFLYFNFITTSSTWSRADYKTIGQYDVSGGYADWILTSPWARRGGHFVMAGHPDRRIVDPANPNGTTGGTDFRYVPPPRFTTGFDRSESKYAGSRYGWYPPTESGPVPYILRAELLLNKAEGLLRQSGSVSVVVVDMVNATRVGRGGLPPLTITADPDVVLDAIFYERRIETFGTCAGCAYFNRRGEGALASTNGIAPGGPDAAGVPGGFDHLGNPIRHHQGLVEGSPLHFAPPGKELMVLNRPIYTYGGVGNEFALPLGPAGSAGNGGYSVRLFYVSGKERLRRAAAHVFNRKALVRYPH